MESKLKTFLRNAWSKVVEIVSLAEHVDVVEASNYIRKNITLSGPNAYVLACAIFIASIGLNVNSTAVIIGAMLISPLMSPIIGVGYSLGVNDTQFLRKSAANLLYMVIISLLVSAVYFIVSPLELETTTELDARTNPTIYDVLIALFGGLAGIIEISNKQKGTVFSGVAIATALMPPLCTAGYGLATLQMKYLIGALYLFFINSVFIALAAFLVVKALKYPVIKFADPSVQRRVHRTISLVMIILIVPSVYSAITTVKENRFVQEAKQFVKANRTLSNAYIFDYSISHHEKPPVLKVSFAGETLSDAEIEALLRNGEAMGIPRNQIEIQQSITTTKNNATEKEVIQSLLDRNEEEVRRREDLIAQMERELSIIKGKELPYAQIAKEILAQYPQITGFSIARGAQVDISTFNPQEQIIVIVDSKEEISVENMDKLKGWLRVRLDFQNLAVVQNIVHQ